MKEESHRLKSPTGEGREPGAGRENVDFSSYKEDRFSPPSDISVLWSVQGHRDRE